MELKITIDTDILTQYTSPIEDEKLGAEFIKYSTDDIELTWISRAAFVRCPVCGQKLFQI